VKGTPLVYHLSGGILFKEIPGVTPEENAVRLVEGWLALLEDSFPSGFMVWVW
jgi:hypothetical protein